MDKEFAEAFKEEIELDEMKWAVGGVYHQEYKNGDKVYLEKDINQRNNHAKQKKLRLMKVNSKREILLFLTWALIKEINIK